MIDERLLFGYPVEFKDVCLIYPPKNKDIVALGYDNFWKLVSYLTVSYEDLYDVARERARKQRTEIDLASIPTPWENLWYAINNEAESVIVKNAIYLFTKQKIFFLKEKKEIIIGPIEEHRSINETNFFDFQNMIRTSIGIKKVDPPNLKMHPKIREMKAKQRERDRVKAKQNSSKCSYSSILLACCCMNMGIDLENILEKTYVITSLLYKIGCKKEKYEIDVLSILHGADSKKIKIEPWRDIDKDDY